MSENTLYENINYALSDLAYRVRQAQEHIRPDTPVQRVQVYMDSILLMAQEMSEGKFHE